MRAAVSAANIAVGTLAVGVVGLWVSETAALGLSTEPVSDLQRRHMRFIGHRGASALEPENTLAAIRMALAKGVGFEIDLQILADGNVIILHDETMWRTSAPFPWLSLLFGKNASRFRASLWKPVHDLSIQDVRQLRVGSAAHAEPLPTFTDALHLLRRPPPCVGHSCRQRFVHCFAEIKSEGGVHSVFDPRLPEASASAVVNAGITPAELTWISFSLGALQDMKARLPRYEALLIAWVLTANKAWEMARLVVESGLDGIDLPASARVVTCDLVAWLHAHGKKVAVWVWRAPAGNDVESVWSYMSRCGVDYFTSNIPPTLHRWRHAG